MNQQGGEMVGGTPINVIRTNANSNGGSQSQAEANHNMGGYFESAGSQGNGYASGGDGGGRNYRNHQPTNEMRGGMLNNLQKNFEMDDLYVPLFAASIFYLGHNKILTRSLNNKFGESSQYVAMVIIMIATLFACKYLLKGMVGRK